MAKTTNQYIYALEMIFSVDHFLKHRYYNMQELRGNTTPSQTLTQSLHSSNCFTFCLWGLSVQQLHLDPAFFSLFKQKDHSTSAFSIQKPSFLLSISSRNFQAKRRPLLTMQRSRMLFRQASPCLSLLLLIATIQMARIIAAVGVATADGEEPVLELYMHDILGGSNPTARPITGLLGNIYSGQVPFARPLGFLPPKNGVAIPDANGAMPTVNANGVPLGTGLAGTTFAGTSNGQSTNGQSAELGPDGLGLGFGTITVIDDILTTSPDLGSQQIGKAQGVYVASSSDGTTQMMVFSAMIEGGEYGDSLNFFGVFKIGSTMSRLSVTGGTGRFKNACGYAELRPLIAPGQHVTNGAETLLRITAHLTY